MIADTLEDHLLASKRIQWKFAFVYNWRQYISVCF